MVAMNLRVFSAHAQNVRLEKGNTYESHVYEGRASVWCKDDRGTTYLHRTRCRASGLNPALTSYVVGPQNTGATELKLQSVHDDGSQTSKQEDYEDVVGRTEDRVNLWISTLFQKPLLKHGVNRVSYQLVNDAQAIIEQGSFDVVVARGAKLICPHDYLQSRFPSDCTGSGICSTYFDCNEHLCQ